MPVDIHNPKFSDVQEKSDEEFQKIVDEEAKTRDRTRYGRDGHHVSWEQIYEYRGVKYQIKLLRYYILDVPVKDTFRYMQTDYGNILSRHNRWFVLEHPSETNSFVDLEYGNGEILYADTLHSWNEKQTLEEMFNEMLHRAKGDIDNILDEGVARKIEELRIILNDIDTIRKHSELYPKV